MTTVYLCKKCKGRKRLARLLEAAPGVSLEKVGCQKVCRGPVAGFAVDGRMEWFGRLDKKKRARALAGLARRVTAGKRASIPEILERCRVARRSGRPPR